jgi:cell division protein FtsB
MEKENWLKKIGNKLINKYVITIAIFAVLFVFVGDHSLIQFVKRAYKIRTMESQIELTTREIQEAEHTLRMLENTDSLERFAREKYLMHTDKEDVYLVE